MFANFERPFTPQKCIRLASNFEETRFRLRRNFWSEKKKVGIFFGFLVSKIKFRMQTLNGRLPLENASVWAQTLRKRISDCAATFGQKNPKVVNFWIFGLRSSVWAFW